MIWFITSCKAINFLRFVIFIRSIKPQQLRKIIISVALTIIAVAIYRCEIANRAFKPKTRISTYSRSPAPKATSSLKRCSWLVNLILWKGRLRVERHELIEDFPWILNEDANESQLTMHFMMLVILLIAALYARAISSNWDHSWTIDPNQCLKKRRKNCW